MDSDGCKLGKDVLHGGAHWCHMANTTEPSMCGSDATFLSNYFGHACYNENDEERKFRNFIPCTAPQSMADACTAPVPCSNAANIGERKTWDAK